MSRLEAFSGIDISHSFLIDWILRSFKCKEFCPNQSKYLIQNISIQQKSVKASSLKTTKSTKLCPHFL